MSEQERQQQDRHPALGPGKEQVPHTPVVIESRDLLRGAREVYIEHGGVRYLLRVTRRNKLILQK